MIMQLFLLLLVLNALLVLYLIRRTAQRTKGWLCLSCNYISFGFLGYILAKVLHILRYETRLYAFSYAGAIIEVFSILLILLGFLKLNKAIELLDHEKISHLKVEEEKISRQSKSTKKKISSKKKTTKTS